MRAASFDRFKPLRRDVESTIILSPFSLEIEEPEITALIKVASDDVE